MQQTFASVCFFQYPMKRKNTGNSFQSPSIANANTLPPCANLHSAHEPESPLKKSLISAGMTWAFELGIGHYLEFMKISKQTKRGTYFSLTNEIVVHKGFIGIWDGFFPWGTIQSLAKGAVFGWGHAMTRKILQPLVKSDSISNNVAEIIAGGCGGGFQGLVLSPTLLLKTRVMTDPVFRSKMTLFQTINKSASVGMQVIRNEGLITLMKGSVVFSLKRIADWSSRFFFSVMAENILFKQNDPGRILSAGEKMTASLVGGTLSALSTIPIDVLVAQIHQASKAGKRVSVWRTFKIQYDKGGIGKLCKFSTKGFIARTLHVALTTALMKTMTSLVYEHIK